ncbi:hypothetical protein H9P43_000976 [Blastocladiella emersonii ATCC 22665]|nr:hypothetical protein H9P43_000976 [Blastocladiella emersonii ATCC 22665]
MGSAPLAKVHETIVQMSRGSAYYQNEERKSAATDAKIARLRAQLAKLPASAIQHAQSAAERTMRDLEAARDVSRTIVHFDMDAFYASVEELDNPSLRDVPMAVGGMSMLCTANYAARKFGVRAAMPGYIAMKLCPHLVITPLRFDRYRALSKLVRGVLARYDPNMQPVGLDESYIDLTEYLAARGLTDPQPVVEEIRQKITEATQLTASAGIAPNKMLAKIGSDLNKPNGQHYLPGDRDRVVAFMRDLRMRKISGVGKVTEHTLDALGVRTGSEVLANAGLLSLVLSEKAFAFILRAAMGIGSTRVSGERGMPKSISAERTFRATTSAAQWTDVVTRVVAEVAAELKEKHYGARHLAVKVKTSGFVVRQVGRAIPGGRCVSGEDDLIGPAMAAFEDAVAAVGGGGGGAGVELRLIGVRVADLLDLDARAKQGLHRFFGPSSAVAAAAEVKGDASPPSDAEPAVAVPVAPKDEEPGTRCPVCDTKVFAPGAPNDEVNRHVDECLTRAHLAAEPSPPPLPRPVATAVVAKRESPAAAVARRPAKKQKRTLHDFF